MIASSYLFNVIIFIELASLVMCVNF
jgi:hypothetical protein